MILVGRLLNCYILEKVLNIFIHLIQDTYCWIHSTFTLPNNAGSLKNEAMPIPGMGAQKENEPIVYHKYYQVQVLLV